MRGAGRSSGSLGSQPRCSSCGGPEGAPATPPAMEADSDSGGTDDLLPERG